MSYFAYKQRGISLITAIFVLVVLGGLAGYMVSISGTQHFTTMQATQSARAYYAARSALEWGIASECTGSPPATILDHNITFDCTASTHTEDTNDFSIFHIVVTAQSGTLGNPGFAAREIRAYITNAP